MDILNFIQHNRLYLDGAMGSVLISMGYDTNGAELLNITNPDVISSIHKGYLDAGTRLIYTNTFGANSHKMKDKMTLEKVVKAAVTVAKDAARPYGAYVGYDCGPTGRLLEPFGKMTLAEAYSLYAEQADIIKDLPIDIVALETFSDTLEMKTALLAFKERTNFPVMCSMSFSEGMRTFTGAEVKAFCLIAESCGADAIGLNCSLGADGMLNLVKEIKKVANVPVFIKPNAGMPVFMNGKTSYDTDAETFSCYMADIAKEGISVLGGCCGTDAEYIKKTVEKTKDIPFSLYKNEVDAVCSYSALTPLDGFFVIGERLNPTGKPLLKQAIIDDDYDYISSLCLEQAGDGAHILDVNAGMPGIDEAEKLMRIILKTQHITGLPLQIDTVKPAALEKALRALDGVGIINSVNAEQESLDKILPLAKKYGAYIVGLPLDGKGIPETAKGRLALAEKIVAEAEKYGIPRKRIIIDPLTLAVSVNANNAKITLETIALIKEKLNVKTVIGLSNVSFGLPNREIINAQFYKMAKDAGLTFAIVNPKLRPATNDAAQRLLLGLDEGCAAYIASRTGAEKAAQAVQALPTIEEAIVKGLKKEALEIIKKDATAENYSSFISGEITGGLNKLGDMYEKGKAYLPQLMAGAEAAQAMLSYIKEKFIGERIGGEEVMLIATVKGDVHDIGKNIVKAILSNYDYRIIDLGKDVGTDAIIEAIIKYNPRYIGLSALMTTTLENMAESVKTIKAAYPRIVVAVGGAVVSASFAAACGADIYARDAQDAVNKLKPYRKKESK